MKEITKQSLSDGSTLGFSLYPSGIPAQLKEERCWIVVELKQTPTKLEKPPLPGFKPKDPSTWKTFTDAVKYAAAMYETGGYDGCYPACIIPDGFIVVDLDNHTGADNADLDLLYNAIIKPFGGGFIEQSISGRGWHITGQAVWDSAYSLTAKSDEGIDIQIRQPGGYILLTGNLHASGQPQLVNIESFLPVLHDYFKESLIPDFDLNDASLTVDDGEVLQIISESYPVLHQQLLTPLKGNVIVTDTGEFADLDCSARLMSCARNIYDICRNAEQTFKLLTACPVGMFENRSDNKQANSFYSVETNYYDLVRKEVHRVCAKVEASKAAWSDVKLDLNLEREWAPKDRSAELPENEGSDYLSPYAFYQAAPANMKVVLDFLAGTDKSKREMLMDYAIAAALSMAGLATGKAKTVNVNGHENFIAPALIVLGASGTGKSVTTSFINKVNGKAVRFNRSELKDKTTEHTSHPKRLAAYMDMMSTNPNRGFVLHFDEATEFFTALSANNHTYFSQYVLSATMERKKGGHLAGNARSDKENDVTRIVEPCFGILMAAVEKTLLDVLNRKSVTDGTLSRFLIIPDSGMRLQARSKEQIMAERLEGVDPVDVPDSIMVMYEQMSGKGTPSPEEDVSIKFENMLDYADYIYEMDSLVAKYQDDSLRASFFQRFAMHWSHIVGCLAMYDNPVKPVIKRGHCDWAFKYILRSIQGITHKLIGVATDATDDSDVAVNIIEIMTGVLKTYGRKKDWAAVEKNYGSYVKKDRNPGLIAAHLDAKAFAESLFTAKASRFVAKDFRGDKKRAVQAALDNLCLDGVIEKKMQQFGGRPGTFYIYL